VIRPFNTYGPRQSARAVIPTIISQIANGKDVLHLGNIEPTRDFTYVDDIVAGFIAATNKDGIMGEVIQLGSGQEIAIGDLADKIAELMKRKITIKSDTQRIRPEASEVDRLLCDNSEAKTKLGWEPTVSFDDGLGRTIEWLSKQRDIPGYNPDRYTI
jgi:dTDP-glucose 4,6-dehydratase